MNPRNTFTWLGLDPSLTAFGWTVFCDDGEVHSCQLYKAGVWETEKDPRLKRRKGEKQKPGVMADTAKRMHYQGEQLARLVQSENPVAIFTESLALPRGAGRFATSTQTVSSLGRIRGLIEGVGIALGVPVFEFGSQALKRVMTGRNDAEKEEVAKRILQLYPSLRLFFPKGKVDENVTDAAAVGHLGEQHAIIAEHRAKRAEHLAGGPEWVDRSPTLAFPPIEDLPFVPPPEEQVAVRIDGRDLPLPVPTHSAPSPQEIANYWLEDT